MKRVYILLVHVFLVSLCNRLLLWKLLHLLIVK
uniref:Uncharacterized protein n=1 Tax=virus sp. ctrcb4 TaxID=2825824 RepID=A0A8S5RPT3_9VIRU|nr:MAG TPA: hypothetical protein [virus sp. ctrcb4]